MQVRTFERRDWLPTLAGPVLAGAALGFHAGPGGIAAQGLRLPGVLWGVAAVTLPALYIGMAMTGLAPPLGALARGSLGALRSAGIVLLGFAPALLFLAASSPVRDAWGFPAVFIAALLCVRALYLHLFEGVGFAPVAQVVFTGWAAVAGGLGLHFLTL